MNMERTGYGVTTSYNRSDRQLQMKQLRNDKLGAGAVITGIWNKRSYRVERCLGQGSNGVVYLVAALAEDDTVKTGSTRYALKLGADTIEFQSEINVIRALEQGLKEGLNRHRSNPQLPYFIEADDWETGIGRRPFYVMRYVSGQSVQSFVSSRGSDWFGPLCGQVLERLVTLHEQGFIFGDLKLEHIKVKPNGEVDLIDYGGLTQLGKSVKQFTEWYDRGFWNAGSRAADVGYDLFSFAVMTIHLCQDSAFKRVMKGSLPQTRQVEELLHIIDSNTVLAPYREWYYRALSGKFNDSRRAFQEWQRITRQVGRTIPRRPIPTPSWLKWSFGVSLLLLLISIGYWAWHERWLQDLLMS
ncbi:serine/threonine protein kinase [Paenibacillus sp. SC116]|nr:serine/threonine protein kinase [Paenibacillus sp. SC116]